jgi:CYTH domain-containing protein
MKKPAWLGDEVTTDHRYYNAYLSGNPCFIGKFILCKLQ